MEMSPEVESLRMRLDKVRTGANAHTVNKAMTYLWECDKQKSVITRARLIAACERALTTNEWEPLALVMKGWW